MAKRSDGGGEHDWRRLLAAVVAEYGTRKAIGPYTLTVPRRALGAAAGEGTLAAVELPNGDRLLTYSPPKPAPRPKR